MLSWLPMAGQIKFPIINKVITPSQEFWLGASLYLWHWNIWVLKMISAYENK